MSFYGNSFIFNGVSSELYDLRLFDFEVAAPSEGTAGGSVTVKEEWLYRREKPYFYGTFYESHLEFEFVVGSFAPIDGASRHAIHTWLIGRNQYLPMRIVQDDIGETVFNVIITESTNYYVGNLQYGIRLHAKCDRPWGVYTPPTFLKTFPGGYTAGETFRYFNNSAYGGYNKPTLSFTTGVVSGSYVSIVNESDNNREFRFDDLSVNEVITVDNDKGIITSDTGLFRMQNFNKKFFRLLPGVNTITIRGYLASLSLDTEFARGIGA